MSVLNEKGSGNDNTSDAIVFIEPSQMALFQKRLVSLNKKAAAFGLDPIRIIDTKDMTFERRSEHVGKDGERLLNYLVPVREGQSPKHPVILTRIEIEYPEIALGNWRVVGKLEAVEGGNLAFLVSQDKSDVAAMTSRAEHPIECEHCKTKRYRKDGYLLRDAENGDYKQVGSSCLEDFTGIDPAAALFLARMSDVVNLAKDDLGDFLRSGRANAVNTRGYLADVSFITENTGFVSSAKARDTGLRATYDEALSLPHELQRDNGLRAKYESQIETHLAKADAVRNWAATKPDESSFDHNVKLLLKAESIALDRKHLAFAAAAVPMYSRALASEAEARKPSEHIGTPGQKMSAITLTVDRVVELETPFGISDLVLMHDQLGNRLKWKTSACPYEIRKEGIGRSMEASFKVKQHDDYKGVAQTAITHLKMVRWLDQENTAANVPDASVEQQHEPLYRVSMFLHAEGQEKFFSTPTLNSKQLTRDELVTEARARGIDQLRAEGEFIWFVSPPDEQGRTSSLHMHEVEGREPSADDYQQIADLLGVAREYAREAGGQPELG